METQKKCSSKKHSDINAVSYCQECNKYICNKCENLHNEFFEDHHKYNLKDDINEIFTGICKEKNHKNELEFYCKNHNILCCVCCFCKIKEKGYGQHSDCDICTIEKIKDEKKDKLTENIKILEELSINLDNSFNELKNILEKVNKNKEELKLKISKIFTQIRNTINQREDELLLEVDSIFKSIYVDDNFINKNKNLPNKIKISLEKGKSINNEWDNNNIRLNSIINDCLNIENNINNINEINKNIEKYKSNNETNIVFIPDKENFVNEYLENIKKFGQVHELNKNNLFKSDIIGDDNEIKKAVKDWINPDIKMKFTILFKMSRDGSNCEHFHRFCDNKGKTLTIIETDNGYKFGGFTPLDWDSNTGNKDDDLTFLFSINQMKKFSKKTKGRSIYCNANYGPCFGYGSDLGLNKDMKTGWLSNYNFLNKYDLTNGSKDFKVKEMEIFNIEYINK